MAISDKLEHLLETKQAIKAAIQGKGQAVTDTDSFRSYAEKIEAIGADGADIIPIGMIDGTLETFNAGGAESVAPFRCYEFENLKSVDLTGVKEVRQHAFYCCRNIENLVIDNNSITKVDGTAFFDVGRYTYQTSSFEFMPANECFVGNGAFKYALPLKTIIGQFSYIGDDAFEELVYVTTLNISGKPTCLGSYAFSGIGGNRANPESNKFYINFKNGSFETVGSRAFGIGGGCGVKYTEIRLPATVSTIDNHAFYYSDHLEIYFYGAPATLNSTAFEYAKNHRIFVPYTKINAYRTATNWSVQSANIRGFADAGTFAQGQQLPMYNSEGYALTWYSDKDLTQMVTEVTSLDDEYYCTAGAEKVAVGITKLSAKNVDLVVSDGTNQYYEGYGVPIGTTLTITATPKGSGYIPYQFTFNGETIISGATYTTVADTDIEIVAVYWDGVNLPANPNFADNDWLMIKAVAQAGTASEIGWAVGDTKPITIDGTTYNIRISDMTAGRYQYSNENRTTNMVFELVEILPTVMRMNSISPNVGGWAESELRKTLNGLEGGQVNFLSTLPQDLQDVLEEVQIKSANGGSTNYTGVTESANKLFLLSMAEVFSTTISQYLLEGSRYGYYIQNDTNAARVKKRNNNANWWWLRSPYSSYTSAFGSVTHIGDTSNANVSGTNGVSFAFAW